MRRSVFALSGCHYDVSPGDGTRYDFVTVDDPYGGVLVIWPGQSTWRWYPDDYLKFLHGTECEYARKAIYEHLQMISECE